MSDGKDVSLRERADAFGLAPVDHLATVMLSPPVLGAVRTGRGDK